MKNTEDMFKVMRAFPKPEGFKVVKTIDEAKELLAACANGTIDVETVRLHGIYGPAEVRDYIHENIWNYPAIIKQW